MRVMGYPRKDLAAGSEVVQAHRRMYWDPNEPATTGEVLYVLVIDRTKPGAFNLIFQVMVVGLVDSVPAHFIAKKYTPGPANCGTPVVGGRSLEFGQSDGEQINGKKPGLDLYCFRMGEGS